jgi:selenocysteine lyase/cysteine desulfurase
MTVMMVDRPVSNWIPPLLPVVGSSLRVPLVGGREVQYAHLDYAASAPALVEVAAGVAEALPYYASVHRGAGFASQVSTRLYDKARERVADYVRARPDDLVIFTRHTTDALTLLSGCVPVAAGDVIVLDIEHHANLLPWRRGRHRYLPHAATFDETLCRLAQALADRPAALVAVTGASNVTGEIVPIHRVIGLAHRHGARVVVDAAQLAPHRGVDLTATGADYVAFSGHKLFAPFGVGVLAGRRDWLDAAAPYLPGGGAVREVGTADTWWADSPDRHEAGSPNVLGAHALAIACSALDRLPMEELARHDQALRTLLLDGLADLGRVRVHRMWTDTTDAVGLVTFSVAGYPPGLVAAYLSAEHGIGLRDGRFCAHPLLTRLGMSDGAVRASVGVGSTSEDIERLLAGLEGLLADGPRWTYRLTDGRWAPTPETRPAPAVCPDLWHLPTPPPPCQH